MPKCSVDSCNKESWCRGVCQSHYRYKCLSGEFKVFKKPRAPLHERLDRFFNPGGVEECWPWTGNVNKKGYGYIGKGGKGMGNVLAHRVAWERVNDRPVPPRMVIMHTCDRPSCVNPSHLRLGTYTENSFDMVQKKRGNPATGTRNASCKLSDDQVKEIRSAEEPHASTARRYGVDRSTISIIRARKIWKHLE